MSILRRGRGKSTDSGGRSSRGAKLVISASKELIERFKYIPLNELDKHMLDEVNKSNKQNKLDGKTGSVEKATG